MGQVVASYDPGADITCQATAALTGGRGVAIPTVRNVGGPAGIADLGDGLLNVGLPAAGAPIFGVASHDAAIGGRVNIMRAPKVVPMEATAVALAVGVLVMVDAAGRILLRTAGNSIVGRTLSATTGAAGEFAQVELYPDMALTLT
jgi:hypothetical protein